jgi:hypothetical protein
VTVAERLLVPERLASRREPCPMCTDAVEVGDPIKLTTPALGWAHAACAEDYFEAYPEAREKVAAVDLRGED